MTCQRVREKLVAYLVNALEGEEVMTVETHLSTCRACQKRFQELSRLDALLQKEVPRYWQEIRPEPEFLARLERLDPPGVGVWEALVNGAFSWLRRLRPRAQLEAARLAAGIALVAAVLLIATLIGETGYGRGILGQRSESPPAVAPAQRAEVPLVPEPPASKSLEEVQQQVEYPIHLPSQLPKGFNSQRPLFRVFELDDGRKLIGISYITANGDALALYEAKSRPTALFMDRAWERIRQRGEPGSGSWQQGQLIELEPGVRARWVEIYGPQGSKTINLHWREDGLELLLSGSFPLKELVKVAQSIR